MLVAQGQQIPTGKLSGVRLLSSESPQQRNHRKKHCDDTHYFQASLEPEFVLRFILLYPRSPDNFVDLGALKGNIGNQNYTIPANVKLDEYKSVSIWCRRFAVNYGEASLEPVGQPEPGTNQ